MLFHTSFAVHLKAWHQLHHNCAKMDLKQDLMCAVQVTNSIGVAHQLPSLGFNNTKCGINVEAQGVCHPVNVIRI